MGSKMLNQLVFIMVILLSISGIKNLHLVGRSTSTDVPTVKVSSMLTDPIPVNVNSSFHCDLHSNNCYSTIKWSHPIDKTGTYVFCKHCMIF